MGRSRMIAKAYERPAAKTGTSARDKRWNRRCSSSGPDLTRVMESNPRAISTAVLPPKKRRPRAGEAFVNRSGVVFYEQPVFVPQSLQV